MKKLLFLLLLVLAGMACSLTNEAGGALAEHTPILTGTPAGDVSKIAPVAVLAGLTPSPTSPPVCIVTAHALTLRAGPGVDFHALDFLTQGEALTVLEDAAGWWKVTTQTGQTGWINSTYCATTPTNNNGGAGRK